MTKHGFLFAFVLSASSAFGQLDSNSITVTAIRSAAFQADQVVFSVDVTSALNTSLDDVIAAVSAAGISVANFSNVNNRYTYFNSSQPPMAPTIDWSFSLAVPLAKMKDTIDKLAALQKTITQNNSGMTLAFSVYGLQVSADLARSQTCTVTDLLSDARSQAQNLATAANLYLGSVLAMSGVTSMNAPSYASVSSCSLTVKFGVTRLM
jgi:hypothetical protein